MLSNVKIVSTPDASFTDAIDLSSDDDQQEAALKCSEDDLGPRRRLNISPRKSPSKRQRSYLFIEQNLKTRQLSLANDRRRSESGHTELEDEGELSVIGERSIIEETQVQATDAREISDSEAEDEDEDEDEPDTYDEGDGFVVPDSQGLDELSDKEYLDDEDMLETLFADDIPDLNSEEIIAEDIFKKSRRRPQPNIHASKRITEFVQPLHPKQSEPMQPQIPNQQLATAVQYIPPSGTSSVQVIKTQDSCSGHTTPVAEINAAASSQRSSGSAVTVDTELERYFEGMTKNELSDELVDLSNSRMGLMEERLEIAEDPTLSATVKSARRARIAPEYERISKLYRRCSEILRDLRKSQAEMVKQQNQPPAVIQTVIDNGAKQQSTGEISYQSAGASMQSGYEITDSLINGLDSFPEPDVNFDIEESVQEYFPRDTASSDLQTNISVQHNYNMSNESSSSKYFINADNCVSVDDSGFDPDSSTSKYFGANANNETALALSNDGFIDMHDEFPDDFEIGSDYQVTIDDSGCNTHFSIFFIDYNS